MKKTIKLSIILNTLLVLTTIVLILSTHLNSNKETTPPKKEQIIIDTIPPIIELTGTDITLEENNGISQEVKHFHLHIIPKNKENTSKLDLDTVFHKIVD